MDTEGQDSATDFFSDNSEDGDSEEGVDTDDAMNSFVELIKEQDPTRTKESNYTLPYTLEELGLVIYISDDVVSAIENFWRKIYWLNL